MTHLICPVWFLIWLLQHAAVVLKLCLLVDPWCKQGSFGGVPNWRHDFCTHLQVKFCFLAFLVGAAVSRWISIYLTKYKWVSTVFKWHRRKKTDFFVKTAYANVWIFCEYIFFTYYFNKTCSCHRAAGWNLCLQKNNTVWMLSCFLNVAPIKSDLCVQPDVSIIHNYLVQSLQLDSSFVPIAPFLFSFPPLRKQSLQTHVKRH